MFTDKEYQFILKSLEMNIERNEKWDNETGGFKERAEVILVRNKVRNIIKLMEDKTVCYLLEGDSHTTVLSVRYEEHELNDALNHLQRWFKDEDIVNVILYKVTELYTVSIKEIVNPFKYWR